MQMILKFDKGKVRSMSIYMLYHSKCWHNFFKNYICALKENDNWHLFLLFVFIDSVNILMMCCRANSFSTEVEIRLLINSRTIGKCQTGISVPARTKDQLGHITKAVSLR